MILPHLWRWIPSQAFVAVLKGGHFSFQQLGRWMSPPQPPFGVEERWTILILRGMDESLLLNVA